MQIPAKRAPKLRLCLLAALRSWPVQPRHHVFGHLFGGRCKGDKGKVAIVLRLRAESTVTLAWIAERLRMGTATHLAHLLYWHRRESK